MASWDRRAYWAVLRRLPLPMRRRLHYFRAHRRLPRLKDPQRFSEKVNWRIVYDRRPVLAPTCDKLVMKERAKRAGLEVPRTLWSGSDVAEILDLDLPPRWVLKPNHGSGTVHLGRGRPELDELRQATHGWMEDVRYGIFGEWAYSQAERCILLEEWIGTDDTTPTDYKCFVFDGRSHFVQVDVSRFTGHRRRFYRRDWTPLDVEHTFPLAPVEPPPARLGEMLEAAATMSTGLEFIRVDFYLRPGAVTFGEVTPYPGGGQERFEPDWLDFELGGLWTLPELSVP